MESHDDDEKRRYHTDLIRSVLKEQFPQASGIRVVHNHMTRAEVFHVDFDDAPSDYRLRVLFTVLVDSRRDSEIEGVVAKAAAMMLKHPRQQVTVPNDLKPIVDPP